jgi:hypothetical protein
MFYHVVYVSSASQPFSKAALLDLLEKARSKNSSLGVTGMLLFKDGNFMQVLEGEQETVKNLAKTIERDPRHKDFILLIQGTSEQRFFSDWSMGFRDLRDKDIPKPPGYTEFMNSPLTSAELSNDKNRCLKLLLLFKQNM